MRLQILGCSLYSGSVNTACDPRIYRESPSEGENFYGYQKEYLREICIERSKQDEKGRDRSLPSRWIRSLCVDIMMPAIAAVPAVVAVAIYRYNRNIPLDVLY